MGAKEKKAYIPENKHSQKKRAIVDDLCLVQIMDVRYTTLCTLLCTE